MSDAQRYACLIEVWGFDPGLLPGVFGETRFVVRDGNELDDLAKLSGTSINDRQKKILAADVRESLAKRQQQRHSIV